tara:strand:- start:2792 stop:3196 length:405 start_codon:yes stop_codon:yes gene_type:complete
MSYGKVWNSDDSGIGGFVTNRLIDIQIPDDVMQQLYLSIDSKVFISDGGNFTAKLKLDNSEGGRKLQLGFRVDGETPTNGWWETNNKLVERTIKNVPNDVLNYLGLGYADDQIRIKYTVDTSTWSAILEKESVI